MVGFALVAMQAQSGPDLSGIWKTNPEKSKFANRPRNDYRIKVEQQGQELTVVTRNGQGAQMQSTSAKYQAGGDTTNGPAKSHAEWNGSALVVSATSAGRGGVEVKTTDEYALSDDKKMLTLSHKVQRGDQTTEDVIVMDRQPAGSWEPDPMAEAVFKNIKVLQGTPAPQLRPLMGEYERAIGGNCQSCHAQGGFDKDDNPKKETARHMIQMVASINKNNFGGAQEVTCWTCHRGNAKPQTQAQ